MSRPSSLPGSTQRVETGWGRVYVNVNELDGEPREVFVTIGQSGGLYNAQAEAIAKACTVALQAGADPSELADALVGIRSGRVATDNGDDVYSIPDAVGIALRRHVDGAFGQAVKDDDGDLP